MTLERPDAGTITFESLKTSATVALLSQDVNGLILPAILIFMLILINDKRAMGKYRNGRFANTVGGVTIGGVIILNVSLLLSTLPGFPWVHV